MKVAPYILLGILIGIIGSWAFNKNKGAVNNESKVVGGELGACITRCMRDNPTWSAETCKADCSSIIGTYRIVKRQTPLTNAGTK